MILRCILNIYKYNSKILKQIVVQEGINMGRKSPWTKEEYISIFNKVDEYISKVSEYLIYKQGLNSSAEAVAHMALNKMPIVYLFIHYHYGTFKDLNIDEVYVEFYLNGFLTHVKDVVKLLKDCYDRGNLFPLNLKNNEIASILSKMCDEIMYIEENF
ncbi:MAG: hypothetical protein UHE91_06035 [Bacteroidales bacterium]|nr:hypothetical protein [Bacteroidales bacterium]